MNWNHLSATLWVRWRILANRVRRAGKLGNTLFALLLGLAVLISIGSFVFALGVGVGELPGISPIRMMAAWGGLGIGFLFFWSIGLVTDLQRGDAMSLRNLLHLPVSLRWVFLYNYLSSFVSLSVTLFLPPMLGLGVAMIVVNGLSMLVVFPLPLTPATRITVGPVAAKCNCLSRCGQ